MTQKKNTFYELVLDYTPFYGEMGGQVGDTGVLVSEDETVEVIDTKRENNQSIHIVKALPKNINAQFMACVDTDKRAGSAANHTATHLLDYALKQVLGDHVEQKGSYVSANTLRFDFSHFQKVTDDELRQVERLVNDMIRQDIPLDEHRDTRIGMFKIVSESSVAAGIRRIEALTGKTCEEAYYALEDSMRQIKALFNNAKDLQGVIAKYIEEHDAMKKDIEAFRAQAVERMAKTLVEKASVVNGVNVIKAVIPFEPSAAKDLVFKIREALPENLLCVIGSTANEKPMLSVMLSDDMVSSHDLNAGKMVREAARLIQGGGGGQPHYAQAGGKNLDGISAAVDKVIELANL